MNYFELSNSNEQSLLTLSQKAKRCCQKFWQFSLFYGNYLANLHSAKK